MYAVVGKARRWLYSPTLLARAPFLWQARALSAPPYNLPRRHPTISTTIASAPTRFFTFRFEQSEASLFIYLAQCRSLENPLFSTVLQSPSATFI